MLDAFNKPLEHAFNESTFTFSAFITSFESTLPSDHAQMIIKKLTNSSLMHRMDSLATSYQITRDHIDSFTYLIIERYSDQQYYEIMIDIEASRHSIIDYDQYLA